MRVSRSSKNICLRRMSKTCRRLSVREMPSYEYLKAVLNVCQERMHTLKDIYEAGSYFFTEPDYSTTECSNFREKCGAGVSSTSPTYPDKIVTAAIDRLNVMTEWKAKNISETVKSVAEQTGQKSSVVMQVLRYAVAGLKPGVGVPVIIEILGKQRVTERLEKCRTSQEKRDM